MSIIGSPRQFHEKHRFTIEIPGFCYAGFAKCSDLKSTIALRKHYEGGASLPHKGPGRVDVENITLERGATRDLDLYTWFSQVAQLATGAGTPEGFYKRDFSIVQKSHSGTTIMRWHVYGAFPVEFVAGEWDNASDEVVIEKLVLAIDYFEPQLEAAANSDSESGSGIQRAS